MERHVRFLASMDVDRPGHRSSCCFIIVGFWTAKHNTQPYTQKLPFQGLDLRAFPKKAAAVLMPAPYPLMQQQHSCCRFYLSLADPSIAERVQGPRIAFVLAQAGK